MPSQLGGSPDVGNVEVTDVVAVNIAGQVHRQIRDLPAGTKISGVTLEEPLL